MTDIDMFINMVGKLHRIKITADDDVIIVSMPIGDGQGDIDFLFKHNGKFHKALGLEWND